MNREEAVPGTRVRMLEGSTDTMDPPVGAVGTVLEESNEYDVAVRWDGWSGGWPENPLKRGVADCWLVQYHLLEKLEDTKCQH